MKYLTAVLFLAVTGPFAFGNLQGVDLRQLASRYGDMTADLEYLQKNDPYMNHWSADWKYPVDKQELVSRLTAISGALDPLLAADSGDIDLCLVKLVVLQDLYNLDISGVYQDFEVLDTAAQYRFPRDYRPLWFAAEFLANAGKSKEAIVLYQHFFRTEADLEEVFAPALVDYAQACYLAGLVRTASLTLEAYSRRTGISLGDLPLAGFVRDQLKPTDPAGAYNPSQVWQQAASAHGTEIGSRVLGFRGVFPGDWKLKFTGYQKGSAVLAATPPAILSKTGKAITINLVLSFITGPSNLGELMKTFTGSFGPGFTFGAPEVVNRGANQIFQVRVTNDTLYLDRGGMAGYALFLVNHPGPSSGFNLESAVSFPQDTPGTSYYRLTAQQDRLPTDVYLVVMVDSCREIADETDNLVFPLVDGFEFR